MGLRSVHLEQAQVLKSGLEGLAGVNRTDSQPTRSMRSAPALEERQVSHFDELPGLARAQLGHFQLGAPEEATGRWGFSGWSSSSKILRRLLGYEGSWGCACLGLAGRCGPGWGGTPAAEGEVGLGVLGLGVLGPGFVGRPGGGHLSPAAGHRVVMEGGGGGEGRKRGGEGLRGDVRRFLRVTGGGRG